MQYHPFISNLLLWRNRRIARFEKDAESKPACDTGGDLDLERHIEESIRWLLRAQQVTGNGGLSEGYNVRLNSWGPAYAETTGYAIPTLLGAARTFPKWEASLISACMEMGYWLQSVQLPSGAIASGNQKYLRVFPSVFNCGQVLQGFHALLHHDKDFDKPARAAAEWMCVMQDDDGAWRKGVSITHTMFAPLGHWVPTEIISEAIGFLRAHKKMPSLFSSKQMKTGFLE